MVADEVRTLASRTQESTEEINKMIDQLQAGVKQAVTAMDKGNQSIEISLEQANKTIDLIDTVAESIKYNILIRKSPLLHKNRPGEPAK